MVPSKILRCLLFAWCVAIFLALAAPLAACQDALAVTDPCGGSQAASRSAEGQLVLRGNGVDLRSPAIKTVGLTPVDFGLFVFDSNQGVCWLADANLAGNAIVRSLMGVDGINADGTMDYATAVNWVNALNQFDNGEGFLGHNDWQLPDTPLTDSSCSSNNNGNFGILCVGDAMGNLYNVGLGMTYPNSVVPSFKDKVWPFENLQPSLYWTADSSSSGQQTYSFDTNLYGSNTTTFNYFSVLPMTRKPIGPPPAGGKPFGISVLPYTSGKAAGLAVYDSNTGLTWAMNANLAASESFGIKGNTTVVSLNGKIKVTAPLIDSDGTMLYSTLVGVKSPGFEGWIGKMDNAGYAGSKDWEIPHVADMEQLFVDLAMSTGLDVGDPRLQFGGQVGPFWNLQPTFYWACERNEKGNNQSPCAPNLFPSYAPGSKTVKMRYSFDFVDGFMGTDLPTKQFHVMMYFPANVSCAVTDDGSVGKCS